ILGEDPAQRIERILDVLLHRAALGRSARRLDLERVPARADHARRLGAEKAVAAPLLAALDALEEKAVRPAVDLQEGRHRGLEVGEDLAVHRDGVPAARERRDVAAWRPDGSGPERAWRAPHVRQLLRSDEGVR